MGGSSWRRTLGREGLVRRPPGGDARDGDGEAYLTFLALPLGLPLLMVTIDETVEKFTADDDEDTVEEMCDDTVDGDDDTVEEDDDDTVDDDAEGPPKERGGGEGDAGLLSPLEGEEAPLADHWMRVFPCPRREPGSHPGSHLARMVAAMYSRIVL